MKTKILKRIILAVLFVMGVQVRASHPIILGALIQPDVGVNPNYINSISSGFTIISNYTVLNGGNVPKIVAIGGVWANNGVWNGINSGGMDGIRNMGGMPIVTWQSVDSTNTKVVSFPLTKISGGTYDAKIQAYATQCKNWGHTMMLRFDHEMSGNWYPWSTDPSSPFGNTGAQYVAAWRHVHDLFVGVGATNVLWVWCGGWKPSELWPSSYPGDAYVDWVAMDEYNWGTFSSSGHAAGQWETLPHAVGNDYYSGDNDYTTITNITSKPIMWTEFGCVEQGGDKGAWIKQSMLTDIPTLYPAVKAVLWFQWNISPDWRINTSTNSLTNFQAAAASPLYAGTLTADGTDLASSAPAPPVLTNILSESESEAVYAKSSDILDVLVDPGFSGGEAMILRADAVNDFVTFILSGVPAGTYDVVVGMKKINTRGQFQLAVAPASGLSWTNVGPVVDEYNASTTGIYTNVDIGTCTLGWPGDKLFGFTVTGKNPSSSSYAITIDYIKLTQLVAPPSIILDQHAGVVINGLSQQTYTVQSISDLTQSAGWNSVATITLTNAVQEWIDPQPVDNSKWFYRTVMGN